MSSLQLVLAALGALWRLTSSTLAVSRFSGTTVWDQKHPEKEMLSGVWIRTVATWGQVSVSGWRLGERTPVGKVFLGRTGSPAWAQFQEEGACDRNISSGDAWKAKRSMWAICYPDGNLPVRLAGVRLCTSVWLPIGFPRDHGHVGTPVPKGGSHPWA